MKCRTLLLGFSMIMYVGQGVLGSTIDCESTTSTSYVNRVELLSNLVYDIPDPSHDAQAARFC